MARQATVIAEPLHSYEGAACRRYRNTDGARYQAIAEIWNSKPMQEIRRVVDSLETRGGRPFTYTRSSLLGFQIVGLLMGEDRRDAHARVQASPALRKLLGLQKLMPKIKRRLDKADGTHEITEAGFPTRQMHSEWEDWLEVNLPRHRLDLSFIEEQAHGHAVLEVLSRHRISTERIAIDNKQILSPIRYEKRGCDEKDKLDPGAEVHTRDKKTEKPRNQRHKPTAVLADIPLVICGTVVSPTGESPYVQDELIPKLAECAKRLRELAAEKGITTFQGIEGALLTGDSAFCNTPVYEAAYKHGFEPCFRQRDPFDRKIVGKRQVRRTGTTAMLDLCSDGTLLCPCDGHRPVTERIPMTQLRGERGVTGHVKVRCDQDCLNSGIAFYVAFTGPTHDLDANPIKAERDLDLVTPCWRADRRVHAIIFKGCNAIEHYNGMLLTLYGLGIKDRNGRRRIHGNFAHQLWYLLADLCWNLQIGFNLDQMKKEEGRDRKQLSWKQLWQNTLRDHFSIRSRKGLDKLKLPVYFTLWREEPDDAEHGPPAKT